MALRRPCFAIALLAVATATAGCGSDDASPGPQPEPEPASCDLGLADETITVADGGRVMLELLVGEDITELAVNVDAGAASLQDGVVELRAPYGAGGTSLVVRLPHLCAGEAAEATVEVPVRVPTWSALPAWTPGVDGPINREYGSFWVDTAADRALAFGGFHYEPQQFTPANELWALDLAAGSWSQLAPTDPPMMPGAGTALVGDGEAYLFGGLINSNTTPYLFARLDYAASPPVFTDLAPSVAPGAGDYQPSLIWDESRGMLLSACGVNTSSGYHCEVRVLDPSTGDATTVETQGDPPEGRNGHFWVHDTENQRLVLFSGDRGAADCDCHPDTWALELAEDPPRWVALDAPGAPVGRRNGAYTLDPDGHRMFVWGGTPDGATTAPGLWALDLTRGAEAWHEVLPAGEAPPERASGAMIYDAARQRLIMGFGNSSAGNFADLWAMAL